MSGDLANQILKLNFAESEHLRMAELSSKAQEGTLSADERKELESYIDASNLLALMQSKARMFLKGGNDSASSS